MLDLSHSTELCRVFADPTRLRLLALLEQEELLSRLTPKVVRLAARKYLDEKNYVKVVLLPEAARPASPVAAGSR